MSCVRLTFLELDTHVAADLAGEEHTEDVPVLLTPHQVGSLAMTGDWPVAVALYTYQLGI